MRHSANSGFRWNNWTRLQAVQFEWEDAPQLRTVRLISMSAQVGDPVRLGLPV